MRQISTKGIPLHYGITIILGFAVIGYCIANRLDFAVGEVEIKDAIVAVAVFAKMVGAVLT